MSGIFTTVGGRRFFLTLLVLVTATAALLLGVMSDSIYRDIVLGTGGMYIAGNVVQKIKAPNAET